MMQTTHPGHMNPAEIDELLLASSTDKFFLSTISKLVQCIDRGVSYLESTAPQPQPHAYHGADDFSCTSSLFGYASFDL